DRLPQVRDVPIGTGEIADQSLGQSRIRERFGVTVLTLARAEGATLLLNPPPETILRPGDRVRVFGLPEQIRAFAESARGDRTPPSPPGTRGERSGSSRPGSDHLPRFRPAWRTPVRVTPQTTRRRGNWHRGALVA